MKKRKYAVTSIASVLFLGLFSSVSVAANPNDNSEKVLKVAVIGDSYTAGNGAGIYVNDNKDGSYHSLNNWGHIYVDWLKEQGIKARLAGMFAYSGSVTDDLLCEHSDTYRSTYNYNKHTCEPTRIPRENKNPGGQIGNIPDDTDLVLLTIGGNDVHFSTIVEQCFAIGFRDPKTCNELADQAQKNLRQPVKYKDDSEEQVSVKQKTETVLKALNTQLKPSAEVVLVGYPLLTTIRPYVLTQKETYSDGRWSTAINKYPAGREVRFLGQEAVRVQREIMDEWNSRDGEHVTVHYVGSVADVFAGHEPDPSAYVKNPKRWINEFFETRTREINGNIISAVDFDQNNWYHPGITGHEKIAGEIITTVGVPSSAHVASEKIPVDVVLVVDSTGSMRDVHDVLSSGLQQVLDGVAGSSSSARFAVATYRDSVDYGDNYMSRLDVDFTSDTSAISAVFDGLGDSVEHQKDIRQGTVYSGIATALDLDWRVDARKVVVVVGDSSARDPELGTGYTAKQVARLAVEAGGVEIYSIDPSDSRDFNRLNDGTMKTLTQATGGTAYDSGTLGDIPLLIDTAVATSVSKPSVWLQGPISGYVGQYIVFDARGSYSLNGNITRYEWDFDGDGIYDNTSIHGQASTVFTAPFDWFASVRVTDDTGRSAVASTQITITVEPEIQTEPDVSPLQDQPGVSEVLDDEAVALFPELAIPDSNTTSSAPDNTQTPNTPTATVRLPYTGTHTPVELVLTLAMLTASIGLVVLALKRTQTSK